MKAERFARHLAFCLGYSAATFLAAHRKHRESGYQRHSALWAIAYGSLLSTRSLARDCFGPAKLRPALRAEVLAGIACVRRKLAGGAS
jgi:hypothetical protein